MVRFIGVLLLVCAWSSADPSQTPTCVQPLELGVVSSASGQFTVVVTSIRSEASFEGWALLLLDDGLVAEEFSFSF